MQFFSLYKLLSYSSKVISSANSPTLEYSTAVENWLRSHSAFSRRALSVSRSFSSFALRVSILLMASLMVVALVLVSDPRYSVTPPVFFQ